MICYFKGLTLQESTPPSTVVVDFGRRETVSISTAVLPEFYLDIVEGITSIVAEVQVSSVALSSKIFSIQWWMPLGRSVYRVTMKGFDFQFFMLTPPTRGVLYGKAVNTVELWAGDTKGWQPFGPRP